jgi:hypothetical protein
VRAETDDDPDHEIVEGCFVAAGAAYDVDFEAFDTWWCRKQLNLLF